MSNSYLTDTVDYLREQIATLDVERKLLAQTLKTLQAEIRGERKPAPDKPATKPAPKPKRAHQARTVTSDDVLALVGKGMTKPSTMGDVFGVHHMVITRILMELQKDGQVKQVDKGRWVSVADPNWAPFRANELEQNAH